MTNDQSNFITRSKECALIKPKRLLTVYEDIYNILIGNPWDDPHNDNITSFFLIHLIAF